MGLLDEPVRWRDRPVDDGGRFLVRQCALCDHGCLEFEWLCACCNDIDRRPRGVDGECGGAREAHMHRPLLPPHLPRHARVEIVVQLGREAITKP